MPKPEAFVYTNKPVTSSHANHQRMMNAQRAARSAGYTLLDSFTPDRHPPDAFLHMIALARHQRIAAVFVPAVDQIPNLSALREICAVVAVDTGITLPKRPTLGRTRMHTTCHSAYHSVAGLRAMQEFTLSKVYEHPNCLPGLGDTPENCGRLTQLLGVCDEAGWIVPGREPARKHDTP
jgi:hypothetical protein